jgi:uncharacterized repeat protein (TIGR01451 family)
MKQHGNLQRVLARVCGGLVLAACLVVSLPALAQTVQLAKVSQGGVGTFSFAMTNLNGGADSVTTVTDGTPATSPNVFIVDDVQQPVTVTETPAPGFSVTAASCVSSGTPGAIGSLSGNVLTIPASAFQPDTPLLCTFTNTLITDLTLNKQVTPAVVASGGTVTYTLTASNVGAADASNAVLTDTPGAGLSCTTPGSCAATGGATCPGSIPVASLFGGGVAIPSLPAGSAVQVTFACTVTATGLPP